MSFTRTAGYRSAALIKPRPVHPGPPASLADAMEEPAPGALVSQPPVVESPPPAPADTALASCHRAALPRASQIAASRDPAFLALVADGDRYRDAGEWHHAETAYSAALACYPYQPGYRVQEGHMRKEQGSYLEAEISYRTAAALGVDADGVGEHLRFVMARQGIGDDRYPIRYAATADAADDIPADIAGMPPAAPDVLLLAALLWRVTSLANTEVLPLLRENATLDDLFAAMVAHPRFAQANIDWLSTMHDGDLAS